MRIGVRGLLILLTLPFVGATQVAEQAAQRAERAVLVRAGEFIPMYGTAPGQKIRVESFRMDRHAVSNEEFAAFLERNPSWRAGSVPPLLADSSYLSHWEGTRPAERDRRRPATFVSWFAAQAYCKSLGGRLPTVFEWEYAAAADESSPDASGDPKFVQRLLDWYARPAHSADRLPETGATPANFWGLHDLHGVIWEWTADFNSVFVSGDNRREGEELENLFCGAGAASAADKANYAAFMRYAMRNSLKASYTTASLGFRCVYDVTRGE